MGADPFISGAAGKTAAEAFDLAVRQAKRDHGHDGYTGTIAEKGSFSVIDTDRTYADATTLAQKLLDEDDPRITETRGPAGAIGLVNEKGWIFFGWASS